MTSIRSAVSADVDDLLELAAERRRQYAEYQPVFWRQSDQAVDRQRPHFRELIEQEAVITLVADDEHGEVNGFAIGIVLGAPPVYDPGGLTCIVDDFAVREPLEWPTVGVRLLQAIEDSARQQGATQIVVVCGHRDSAKRTVLERSGLGIASEWWVGALTTV